MSEEKRRQDAMAVLRVFGEMWKEGYRPVIPNDYSRCTNDECPVKEDCARWVQREMDGKQQPEGQLRSYMKFQHYDGRCRVRIPLEVQP